MSPRRRDEYTWWEYAIMAVVGVLIIVGGIVLVRVIGSSVEESAAPAPTTPAIPPSLLPVTCNPGQWLDEATRTCLPRAECAAGQVYDEATNTCAVAAPRVTSIDPTSGPAAGGTEVTVVGFDFQRGATLTLGGIPATDVDVADSSTITATAPAFDLAYPVDVVVTNPDGQTGTLDNAFIFEQPQEQVITAVIPDTGSTQGGEAVIIKGRDFAPDAVVAFNGRPAQEVLVLAPDTIRVIIPASAAGPASVNVRNPGEDLQTLRSGFTYVDQAPRVVDAIRPGQGPVAGGTKVTITGSGFVPGATVSIGGRPARQVDVVSSTRITAVSPRGGIGPADVAVRNPGIPAAILADGFRYVEAPVIDRVQPRRGPLAGGTEVTITGSGFADDAVVTFGNVILEDVVVVDDGTIRFTTPPASEPIAVTVTVTNPGQPTARLKRAFTYRTGAEPTPEPTSEPTASPSPSPTRPGTLPRCPSFTRPAASTAPGTGLVLTDVDLFPSSPAIDTPRLVDAGIADGQGSLEWQERPPRITWAAPTGGGSAIITYAYSSRGCRGFGTGTIAVSAP
jgi:hypothetical protein